MMTMKITKNQIGAVLPITLIFMALMTLVGVSTLSTSVTSERMAGNYNEANIAFQAAEAALRDAEQDLRCEGCRDSDAVALHAISGLTGFSGDCSQGLCFSGSTSVEVLEGSDGDGNPLLNKFLSYGDKTGVSDVSGVTNQPKYIIEGKKVWPPGAASWKYYYVITAVGTGKTGHSKVILREKFML